MLSYVITAIVFFILGAIALYALIMFAANKSYKETNEHNRKRQILSKPKELII